MKIRLSLLLLAFLFLFQTQAQLFNRRQAEELYWKYRDRLKEFVVVGGESGESLPAHRIHYEDRTAKTEGIIHFADQGIELGWYISMLATEYALLSNTGLPTAETVEELYYALKAYERIDIAGDLHTCVGNTAGTEMNGFFIRDDVDAAFFERNPEFSARFLRPNGTYNFGSNFRNQNCTDEMGMFNSPDQVGALILGFALVKRSLPKQVRYNNESLHDLAVEMATAIGGHYLRHDWYSKGPNGESINKFEKTFREEMEVIGLGGALDWITDFKVEGPLSSGFTFGSDVKATLSKIPGRYGISKESWQKRFKPGSIPAGVLFYSYHANRDDFVPAHNLAFAAVASNVGRVMNSEIVRERISLTSITYDYEVYALANSYLHETEMFHQNHIISEMQTYLSEAPCSGPHFYHSIDEFESGVEGWRAANRWHRSRKARLGQWLDDDWSEDFDYNGLDYMVAHNPLLLYQNQKYASGNTDGISGSNELCYNQSKIYNFNVPFDEVVWSSSADLRIEVLSPNLDRIQVTKINENHFGGSWISATVTDDCGIFEYKKWLSSDRPVVNIEDEKSQYSYRLNLVAGGGALSPQQQQFSHVHWELINPSGYVDLQVFPDKLGADLAGRGEPWSTTVKVTLTNSCGTASVFGAYQHEGDSGDGSGDVSGGPVLAGPAFGGRSSENLMEIQPSELPDTYQANFINTHVSGNTLETAGQKFEKATIFSLSGIPVKTFTRNKIYVGDLAKGIYIIQASANGQQLSKKIRVQ